MDEETFLSLHGERDGTTSFLRSIRSIPQAERIFTEDPLVKKDDLFEIAVVGCSYGMEAYSYAMICETNGFANYRVDGYDVHPKRLEVGRRGWYHFGWATEIALTDPRIKRGLAFKEHKYGQDVVFIDRLVRDKTKFFQHDISLSPLPRFYDLLVCTNVLRQVQRGGRQDAIENLLRSLKEGGLVIQNYDHFNVDEELKRRVNLSVQHELGLLI